MWSCATTRDPSGRCALCRGDPSRGMNCRVPSAALVTTISWATGCPVAAGVGDAIADGVRVEAEALGEPGAETATPLEGVLRPQPESKAAATVLKPSVRVGTGMS